jgi:hypothetical protein
MIDMPKWVIVRLLTTYLFLINKLTLSSRQDLDLKEIRHSQTGSSNLVKRH